MFNPTARARTDWPQIKKAGQELYRETGRPVKAKDIAERLGVGIVRVRDILNHQAYEANSGARIATTKNHGNSYEFYEVD
jgi:DNA-directed RNA polymerase specialized sigma subunit